MSHIFDALQRSEAERNIAKKASSATATELLLRAERQAVLQWEAESISAETGERGLAPAGLELEPGKIDPDYQGRETWASGQTEEGAEHQRIFDSFEAVEISPASEKHLVCLTDKETPAAEAFRLLRVRLRHLRKDKTLKKMLITSTVPEEGKSFVAGNLACALASGSEEKVLLIEGDLRRPTLSRSFGLKARPGTSEFVRGERNLTSSIYHLIGAGIWLLPAGSAESDPLEIIQSPKMPSLMQQLSDWFQWIVIDSPPMLPLADTTTLARMADGILIVTRRDITEKRKLTKGLQAFESEKLIGTILNSSHSAADRDYYYYRNEPAAAEPTNTAQ